MWISINMQNISLIHQFIPQITVNFRVLIPYLLHPFLTMLTPKLYNHLLIWVNLCQHAKNQFIPSIDSWDTINFRIHRPGWQHLFLTMPKNFLIIVWFLWICVKTFGGFVTLFWKTGWFKNPAIWLAENILAFILGTKFFPNIGFAQKHRKYRNFHHRTNSVNING